MAQDDRGSPSAGEDQSQHDIDKPMPKNIYWQDTRVTRGQREGTRGHRGFVLWLTGLSASGKTTLAALLEERLHQRGCATFMLDGDNVRHGLNRDLGFSPEDRDENIRRVGEVARLFVQAGVIVTTSFISPYRDVRRAIRDRMTHEDDFIEVHVSCPIEVCEERDPKGLYAKVRAGEIQNFTGIDAPYEEPVDAEITVHTDRDEPDACVEQILAFLAERGCLPKVEATPEETLEAASGG